jgi:hypothetical protein
MDNQFDLKFRDYPIGGWIFALTGMGIGALIFVFNAATSRYGGLLLIAAGLLILIFTYALTITANKQSRTLTLDYRSLLLHSSREISFDELDTIRVDSRRSHNRNRTGHHTTYGLEAVLKNGEKIQFRSYYSGDFLLKQRTADGLRQFIGLAESIDESPIGIIRASPKIGAMIAQKQQEAYTGANAQEHITNGVHWFLQSKGMGASPMTRWFSPDIKTRNGFLFLAQKMAGQSSGGFMASLGNALFKQTIGLYGFTETEMPNLAQADTLAPLPPLVDTHFTAFTSDQTEARQILTPWVQNPIAEWGQRYPLKQFQSGARFSQLIVMFCPSGVYLATLGVLKPDQVDELTALGVEMVKAQGVQPTDATIVSRAV